MIPGPFAFAEQNKAAYSSPENECFYLPPWQQRLKQMKANESGLERVLELPSKIAKGRHFIFSRNYVVEVQDDQVRGVSPTAWQGWAVLPYELAFNATTFCASAFSQPGVWALDNDGESHPLGLSDHWLFLDSGCCPDPRGLSFMIWKRTSKFFDTAIASLSPWWAKAYSVIGQRQHKPLAKNAHSLPSQKRILCSLLAKSFLFVI